MMLHSINQITHSIVSGSCCPRPHQAKPFDITFYLSNWRCRGWYLLSSACQAHALKLSIIQSKRMCLECRKPRVHLGINSIL